MTPSARPPRPRPRPRHPGPFERLERRVLLSGGPGLAPLVLNAGGVATASGVLTTIGQVDSYRFVAPTTGLYAIEETTPATSGIGTSVALADAQGHPLATDSGDAPQVGSRGNDVGGVDSLIRFELTGGQVYRIEAGADLGYTVNTGAYQLIVSPYAAATTLGVGTRIGGSTLARPGQINFYRFVPPTPRDLRDLGGGHARGDPRPVDHRRRLRRRRPRRRQ